MAKKKPKQNDATFEKSLAELEKIVGELESGEIGLATALERYELGVKHLRACHDQLRRAERRIEIISGIDASGNPIAEAFEPAEPAETARKSAGSRAKGTGSRRRPRNEVDDTGSLF